MLSVVAVAGLLFGIAPSVALTPQAVSAPTPIESPSTPKLILTSPDDYVGAEAARSFPTALIEDINATLVVEGQPVPVIHAASFLWDWQPLTDALIAAHERGVSVQVVIDPHRGDTRPAVAPTVAETERIAKALGTNTKAESFVYKPHSSGMSSSKNQMMHAKLFTFTKTGTAKTVTYVGSGNLASTNILDSWNDHWRLSDPKIYNETVRYFNQLVKDKNQPQYNRHVTSGSTSLFFYPGVSDKRGAMLRSVKSSKGVSIDYAQFSWSDTELADARLLRDLWKKGCNVRVLLNEDPITARIGPKVRRVLTTPYKGRQMPVRNVVSGRTLTTLTYSHLKLSRMRTVTPATSTHKASEKTVVFSGSRNYGNKQGNSDILTRSTDPKIWAAYTPYLDSIWSHGSQMK